MIGEFVETNWRIIMTSVRSLVAVVAALLVITSFGALGDDRVLIVGVGEYQDPDSNLPGIDLDIKAMEDTALLMGFDRSAIKILRDSEATEQGIIDAMRTWLVDGVTANDRVLFYFSGHGSRFADSNGDEVIDQKDEAIIAHDFRIERSSEGNVAAGLLVDESIGYLVSQIPSNNVMVVIDACNSGTATRSLSADPSYFGTDQISSKYLHYGFDDVIADSGVNVETLTATTRDLSQKAEILDIGASNYLAVTAARDDESAIATGNGSLFTLGFRDAIRQTVQQNASITPLQLQASIQKYITDYLEPARVFHPQLTGNEEAFNAPMKLTPLPESSDEEMPDGTMWANLVDLTEDQDELDLTTNAQTYRLGDAVSISVKVPQDGYLNIVTVDSRDEDLVLFPNRFHQDNRVSAGTLTVPTNRMNFTLPASEPLGQTLVVAIFSTAPLDLYESQVGGSRDGSGNYEGDFAQLSGVATRAISIVGTQAETVRAAAITIDTQR